MSYVIDASVAVKWFVEENLRQEAMRLIEDQTALMAPDLIVPEVTNIAWKKATRGEITSSQAEFIAAAIRNSPVQLCASSAISERALRIAFELNHPVYDCLYVACAEGIGDVLVTADARLCNAVKSSPLRTLVRHLTEPFQD